MGFGAALTGKGSDVTTGLGVPSVGVAVSIGSPVCFGVVTVGTSLMGLGTIGIGFSIGLTGFPVGSGVGTVLTIDGIGEVLTTGGSRSWAIDGSMMGRTGDAIGALTTDGAAVERVRLVGVWDEAEPFCKTPWD